MLNIVNVFTDNNFISICMITSTIIVLLLAVIGIISYHKIPFISLPTIIVLDVLIMVLPDLQIALDILFGVLFITTIVIATIEFIKALTIDKARNTLVNYFLGNAVYDYYFATNKKDHIINASESYMDLVSLDLNELRNSKGFQTMLSEMKIQKINGREVTEEVALKFLFDYDKSRGVDETYQFDLQVLIEEEVVFLKGIIQPIHHKNVFLGRNVYLINDKSATFNSLKATIKGMLTELENDEKQTYALMSLTKNAIMYFDYKTTTYVATEAMNNYLGVTQKEFTIEEFFNMIHPEDIRSYQEQGAMINSIMPNRAKLRLYINKKYYDVYDDSLYLNKDSGLVSIISLVNDPEVVSVKKQEEVKNANMWATLEEINPTEVMDDLMSELEFENKEETNE